MDGNVGAAKLDPAPITRDDPPVKAPKPDPGPLAQRVAQKPAAQRSAERAKILSESGTPAPWQVTRGKRVYTISLPRGISVDGNVLTIPRVTVAPEPPLPLDPPYIFVNPPILVPDGTVRDEEDPVLKDEKGAPVMIQVANFKEDPLEAIRQMVADVVLREA